MLPPQNSGATSFGTGRPITWTNAGRHPQQVPVRSMPGHNPSQGGQVTIRPGSQPYTAQPTPRKGG